MNAPFTTVERLRRRFRKKHEWIKLSQPLPRELVIPSAGRHFYQYGLFFYRDPHIKRKFYFSPYFIFFLECLYFGRSLVSLLVPLSYRQYFVYSGDYMFFIRAKTHINIAATQYMLLGINILILNYINYRRNIPPTFLKPFEFLAGKTAVGESGLHNRSFILSIVRKTQMAIRLTELNTKVVCVVSFILSLIPTLLHMTLLESVLFGIPWSLIFAVSSYYTFSSYFWNMTYFYILCHLIKYRIRETNEVAMQIQQLGSIQKWHLRQLERQYVDISNDVGFYNSSYWSKYLFIAIVFLSTFNNTVCYVAFFMDLNTILKASLIYATILSSSAIFFVLNTASVVYHESSRIQWIFYGATKMTNNVSNLFKINSALEAFSTRKIGFYFLNLFVINYFRFYEIFSLLMAYFLKIIELSRES